MEVVTEREARSKPSPYVGITSKGMLAKAGAHVLVSGPTGVGKSRRVLAPASALWQGPAVVVSSKDDVMQLVNARRVGPAYVLDLRPVQGNAVYPPNVELCRFDPTSQIETQEQALRTAEVLIACGSVGMGGSSEDVTDASLWDSQAVSPLAAILFAASPAGLDTGIGWAVAAVDHPEVSDDTSDVERKRARLERQKKGESSRHAKTMERIKRTADSAADQLKKTAIRDQATEAKKKDSDDKAVFREAAKKARIDLAKVAQATQERETKHERERHQKVLEELDRQFDELSRESETSTDIQPCWDAAIAVCFHDDPQSPHATRLQRVLSMDGRQRDSVAMNMEKAVTPWLRESVRGGNLPAWDPSVLDDMSATLYILAPADGTAAGAAVGLIDDLVNTWREKTAALTRETALLLCIDELPNTAPLPKLTTYIGEARGLGVTIIAAVQATSQLERKYGRSQLQELRDIFPSTLILFGAPERELLEAGAWWSGRSERRTESYDPSGKNRNFSVSVEQVVQGIDLIPEDKEHARLLHAGGPGVDVEIPDWSKVFSILKTLIKDTKKGR